MKSSDKFKKQHNFFKSIKNKSKYHSILFGDGDICKNCIIDDENLDQIYQLHHTGCSIKDQEKAKDAIVTRKTYDDYKIKTDTIPRKFSCCVRHLNNEFSNVHENTNSRSHHSSYAKRHREANRPIKIHEPKLRGNKKINTPFTTKYSVYVHGEKIFIPNYEPHCNCELADPSQFYRPNRVSES